MSDHGYEFDINDNRSPYLSQKKLYKGASADYIAMAKDWNAEVKRYNENVKEHIQEEPQMEMEYISIKETFWITSGKQIEPKRRSPARQSIW